MSQIDQFLGSLKRALKAKNVIYRDLAESLNLSESSVKRILSDKSISLERIEEICKACEISFADVCRSAHFEEEETTFRLTKEQEKVLAENPRLLHYFIMLTDGFSPAKIEKDFDITNIEAKKFLLHLDRLNLLELHPKDKVKLKNKGHSLFIEAEGVIGKAIFEQTKSIYLDHNFKANKAADISFSTVALSPEIIAKVTKRFQKIVTEVLEESRFLGEKEKESAINVGILMAIRPWENPALEVIKKRT